jgi:hypothetical protein
VPISVVLNIQQTGRIIIQTYLTPRDRQLSLYTTSASFIKKRAPYERKQLFYPIKRISGIVASAVGLSPRMVGVLATPLYFVVT